MLSDRLSTLEQLVFDYCNVKDVTAGVGGSISECFLLRADRHYKNKNKDNTVIKSRSGPHPSDKDVMGGNHDNRSTSP